MEFQQVQCILHLAYRIFLGLISHLLPSTVGFFTVLKIIIQCISSTRSHFKHPRFVLCLSSSHVSTCYTLIYLITLPLTTVQHQYTPYGTSPECKHFPPFHLPFIITVSPDVLSVGNTLLDRSYTQI
jgi:hypothetical protein